MEQAPATIISEQNMQAAAEFIVDPKQVHHSIFTKLRQRIGLAGELTIPCLPSALGFYFERLRGLLQDPVYQLNPEAWQNIMGKVAELVNKGYSESPNSLLKVRFQNVQTQKGSEYSLNFALAVPDMKEQYKGWTTSRQGPLFGSHPDARLIKLLDELGDNTQITNVLDLGAATGRNALPLARRGIQVDAVEQSPDLLNILRAEAQKENLEINVLENNFLQDESVFATEKFDLALACGVTPHFRNTQELSKLFVNVGKSLKPGGIFLFDIFLLKTGFQLDNLLRESAQMYWSSCFTPEELQSELEKANLVSFSNESVPEYEAKHLPEGGWPPTTWYGTWASGLSVSAVKGYISPIEDRWIVCRKQG